MNRFINILFNCSIGLLPIGLIFRIQHWPGGNLLFTLGLLGLLIYFLAKTIKDLIKQRSNKFNITFQIFIILMSVILFSKYLYHDFGDYPGLLIIPVFIIMAILYLIKGRVKYAKLTTISITYILLSIPLFAFEFQKSPRHYIPLEWYNRYNVSEGKATKLSFSFELKETEELSVKAFELKKAKQYTEALFYYSEARKLEPKNLKLLFDMSEAYARNNDLGTAIVLLDTAIMINDSYAEFYNNRGLLYYKLNDNYKAIENYKSALLIDSTQSLTYVNLGLAYHSLGLNNQACMSFSKAEKLQFDLIKYKSLIEEICK